MEEWFIEQEKDAFAVFAGVVFYEDVPSYEIRTLYSKSALTDAAIGKSEHCRVGSEECPADAYLTNGYLDLQMAIDSIILSNYNITMPRYYTQMMPKDSFIGDSAYIRSFAPIFYLFAFGFFIQVSFCVVVLRAMIFYGWLEVVKIAASSSCAFGFIHLLSLLSQFYIRMPFVTGK